MSDLQGLLGGVRSFLRQRLQRDRIHFVSVSVVAVSLLLLAVSFATADRGRTLLDTDLGADYAGFHAAASILSQGTPDQLYDFELHNRRYHECLPHLPEEARLPYVHPPFVALALRPLAALPYAWSFALWLLVSAGLYAVGLALLVRYLDALPRADRTTAVLLALSFEPFIMEAWLGGQLSAVAFFCVAVALRCEARGRPLAAGAAFGLCLYKPTLLVLLLPMLLLGRRWRTLAGVALTALVLAVVSVLGVGLRACVDYVEVLLNFTRTMAESGSVLRLWKYVDLNSFFRLLLGETPARYALLLLAAGPPLVLLSVSWWRLDDGGAGRRRLIWAATLTWTLVANLYVGVYDTVLVVPAVFLAAGALTPLGRDERSLPAGLRVLLVLLYVVPWFTQPLARLTGVQTYTVILSALGVYLLTQARTASAGREVS